MSLKDLIAADVSNVFLNTNEFAETVTHWPAGVEDDEEDRTVIFFESPPFVEKRDRGKYLVRKARLKIASSVTIRKSDVWFRNSARWETVLPEDPIHGFRNVHLVRTEKIKTRTKNDNETHSTW
ncbi:hypothetical protein [Gimesia maris]|uniref:hypothetical protein n=1 Tax=Gimesia maris TaxID=122 RepID=UPI0032ED0D24